MELILFICLVLFIVSIPSVFGDRGLDKAIKEDYAVFTAMMERKDRIENSNNYKPSKQTFRVHLLQNRRNLMFKFKRKKLDDLSRRI